MAYDQVTVARKLADLAGRPPIHIPARQGEDGMQRVDRWMTENTKTVYGLHLITYAYGMQLCIAWLSVVVHRLVRCFPTFQCSVSCAQSLPSLGVHHICYYVWVS